jgi:hypothetical protein
MYSPSPKSEIHLSTITLNHLQSMDVILLVWVPYRAGIFQGRSYEGHVRFFFDRFVGDVYVPFKKTDDVIGFRADSAYNDMLLTDTTTPHRLVT